ncbi:hypothetical protein ACOZ38_36540 [Sphaerisporangium viridialbum]|uniref:hypothetical protein n=1 Tax=Sphaerisporangium viridialbum TaxID=46189 RepID=UPI003C76B3F3
MFHTFGVAEARQIQRDGTINPGAWRTDRPGAMSWATQANIPIAGQQGRLPGAPDPDDIRPYLDLRTLQVTCWTAAVPRPPALPKEQHDRMPASLIDRWRSES